MWIFSAIANAVGRNFIGRPNYLFDLLFNRVQADGGVTEAQQCTINELTDLQNDNLLSSASLVLTPSSYKEGKLYSVIPSDGSGDMSVTRATTATRVNSAGLVELVPYNLVQYSQDFSNAIWAKTISSITYNQPDPFGGNNAALCTFTNVSTSRIDQNLSIIAGNTYTISAWIKGVDITDFRFIFGSSQAVFVTSQIVNGEWVRVSATVTATTTGTYAQAIARTANTNGESFYIYGAQLVEGTNALPYQKTETRLNIPRLDYSLGGCPNILLEPQRTNLALWSEQFDNAGWVNTNITLTNNSTISPSGILNADTLIATTANAQHSIQQNITISQISDWSFSCYVKNNGGNFVQLVAGAIGFTNTNPYQNFNLQTGTLAQGTLPNSTITNVGNGWYRVTIIVTNNTTGVGSFFIIPILNGTTGRVASFAGDGINGIYAWGAQLEAGAFPTLYIPTTSTSVTRNKDLGNNDVFASTYTLDADFCLFQDFECFDFNNFPVFWSGGNYSTGPDYRSYMLANSTTALNLFGVNEVLTGQLTAFTFSANTRYKLAVRRVGSTISWFINGVKYLNAGGTTTTTIKIRSISGSSLGGQNVMRLNTAVIFEDATLTDAQCIQLTTI
jgi:hypothetical protein